MAQLAIKGHPTRGKEVIEILEMLGGNNNISNYRGESKDLVYFIKSDYYGFIGRDTESNIHSYNIYSLEEFLEKYPFKVGDKVKIYVQNDDIDGICDIEVAEITSMRWNSSCCKIAYKMKNINREFYKEEIKCKVDDNSNHTEITKISYISINDEDYANQIEINLGDNYEYKFEMNKLYIVKKKPKYPKTYEECCDVIGINQYNVEIDLPQPYQQIMFNLFKLLIYRNAYWKIAGEQMGLGKPWEPDWNDNQSDKYLICYLRDELWMSHIRDCNRVLVFPTEEIRDTFYENFKKDIESCKELL